jgi:hypothetical protein
MNDRRLYLNHAVEKACNWVSDRLPVNAEMPGDVPVGPAASRKCQNRLYFGHLELICHRSVRFRREPKANGNGQISRSSKWPVLPRPSLAGFARPMTPMITC